MSITPIPSLAFKYDSNKPNHLNLLSPLRPNEGVMYFKLNSEIQNNVVTFVNVETREQFRTDKLEGRYHAFFIKLPVGKYTWKSVKLNRGLFSSGDDETPQFEVLAGKINYPGDMFITIYSRENRTARAAFIDLETALSRSITEMENYEFHYSYLDKEQQ